MEVNRTGFKEFLEQFLHLAGRGRLVEAYATNRKVAASMKGMNFYQFA
jgi:hypothetical protein